MKKTENEFNQYDYIADWKKKNMRSVNASYKKEFVEQFTNACNKLGIKKSDVIRRAMQETIEQAEKQ